MQWAGAISRLSRGGPWKAKESQVRGSLDGYGSFGKSGGEEIEVEGGRGRAALDVCVRGSSIAGFFLEVFHSF